MDKIYESIKIIKQNAFKKAFFKIIKIFLKRLYNMKETDFI